MKYKQASNLPFTLSSGGLYSGGLIFEILQYLNYVKSINYNWVLHLQKWLQTPLLPLWISTDALMHNAVFPEVHPLIQKISVSFQIYSNHRVIYKEIWVQIKMIDHRIFARSNIILSGQNACLLSYDIMEESLLKILFDQDDRVNKFCPIICF